MNERLKEKLVDAVFAAQRRSCCRFDLGTVYDVLVQCIGVLNARGEKLEHLPFLLGIELEHLAIRKLFEGKGGRNNVYDMRANPL